MVVEVFPFLKHSTLQLIGQYVTFIFYGFLRRAYIIFFFMLPLFCE
jgi:hypothetical protein